MAQALRDLTVHSGPSEERDDAVRRPAPAAASRSDECAATIINSLGAQSKAAAAR
jgi:hypothetical protein